MIEICIEGFDGTFEVDLDITSERINSKDPDDFEYTIDEVTYGGEYLDIEKVCVSTDKGLITVENLLYKALEDSGAAQLAVMEIIENANYKG